MVVLSLIVVDLKLFFLFVIVTLVLLVAESVLVIAAALIVIDVSEIEFALLITVIAVDHQFLEKKRFVRFNNPIKLREFC